MTRPVKALVLHAYSPGNSGDGLLVDLTLSRLRAAFGHVEATVVASDASAFDTRARSGTGTDDVRFVQWGRLPSAQSGPARRLGMALTLLGSPPSRILALAEEADLIVAVGGGYLRGGGMNEAFRSAGAHYGQLRVAAKHGDKAAYFPQSIGPFGAVYRHLVARSLNHVSVVCARDDRTLAEFDQVETMTRVPDLAVLEVCDRGIQPLEGEFGSSILICRPLSRPRKYDALMENLAAREDFELALQSSTGGNNDLPYIQNLGVRAPRSVAECLDTPNPRVTVSTRLHGSLAALLAGHPTVHLSYERKGWGAFEDLGLPDFVLPAREASPAMVLDRVATIQANPGAYWRAVRSAADRLAGASEKLTATTRSLAAQRPNGMVTS